MQDDFPRKFFFAWYRYNGLIGAVSWNAALCPKPRDIFFEAEITEDEFLLPLSIMEEKYKHERDTGL